MLDKTIIMICFKKVLTLTITAGLVTTGVLLSNYSAEAEAVEAADVVYVDATKASSGNTYKTFQEACDNVNSGGTIILLTNCVHGISAASDKAINKSLTIDLNNKQFSGPDCIFVNGNYTVNVKNGTVSSDSGKSCVGTFNGGTINCTNVYFKGCNLVWGQNGGNVYLKEGCYSNNLTSMISGSAAKINVSDGGPYEYTKFEYGGSALSSSYGSITGGCFKATKESISNMIPTGYFATECEHERGTSYIDVIKAEASFDVSSPIGGWTTIQGNKKALVAFGFAYTGTKLKASRNDSFGIVCYESGSSEVKYEKTTIDDLYSNSGRFYIYKTTDTEVTWFGKAFVKLNGQYYYSNLFEVTGDLNGTQYIL